MNLITEADITRQRELAQEAAAAAKDVLVPRHGHHPEQAPANAAVGEALVHLAEFHSNEAARYEHVASRAEAIDRHVEETTDELLRDLGLSRQQLALFNEDDIEALRNFVTGTIRYKAALRGES